MIKSNSECSKVFFSIFYQIKCNFEFNVESRLKIIANESFMNLIGSTDQPYEILETTLNFRLDNISLCNFHSRYCL